MGQAELFDIIAAYIAGIMLIGTLSWLIGKKAMQAVIINSLLGGILVMVLSIFKLVEITSPVIFFTGLLGLLASIIIFFLS